jgi:hypothetical protein
MDGRFKCIKENIKINKRIICTIYDPFIEKKYIILINFQKIY